MNYRYNEAEGEYEYRVVGSWEDNHLELSESEIAWVGRSAADDQIPMSICSLECQQGWRKVIKDDLYACCWVCVTLTYTYLYVPISDPVTQ